MQKKKKNFTYQKNLTEQKIGKRQNKQGHMKTNSKSCFSEKKIFFIIEISNSNTYIYKICMCYQKIKNIYINI